MTGGGFGSSVTAITPAVRTGEIVTAVTGEFRCQDWAAPAVTRQHRRTVPACWVRRQPFGKILV
jgi:hypothetical protein